MLCSINRFETCICFLRWTLSCACMPQTCSIYRKIWMLLWSNQFSLPIPTPSWTSVCSVLSLLIGFKSHSSFYSDLKRAFVVRMGVWAFFQCWLSKQGLEAWCSKWVGGCFWNRETGLVTPWRCLKVSLVQIRFGQPCQHKDPVELKLMKCQQDTLEVQLFVFNCFLSTFPNRNVLLALNL